jgi:hypothetical protein
MQTLLLSVARKVPACVPNVFPMCSNVFSLWHGRWLLEQGARPEKILLHLPGDAILVSPWLDLADDQESESWVTNVRKSETQTAKP